MLLKQILRKGDEELELKAESYKVKSLRVKSLKFEVKDQ